MNDEETSVSTDPTPAPLAPPGGERDPSKTGAAAGYVSALAIIVVMVGAKFGLDLDTATATLIAGALITVVTPLVTALVARLRAWHPDSVAKLQADAMALVQETQSENPPHIVTGPSLSLAEATEAHPGALGLSGPGDEPGTGPIRRPRRHEKP